VLLHYHAQYYDVLCGGRTLLPINLGPGHYGVELFFIISGFVILMTIERWWYVRDFAISRFTRLMPAFLAALSLASALLILWPMPAPFAQPTFWQFMANLTMAPMLFGQNVVDLPYWTLTYEMVFYIYMALCLACCAPSNGRARRPAVPGYNGRATPSSHVDRAARLLQ
jgi:peptidoglycan/LPS O-acetylase OafA/YrhL